MSRRSIRTMSRIESRESMEDSRSFRGAAEAASPESITTKCAILERRSLIRESCGYGFRARPFGPPRNDGRGALPQPDLLECLADPGALVLVRLEPAALHQPVGFLVPLAVREIVTEHRRRGLRLV